MWNNLRIRIGNVFVSIGNWIKPKPVMRHGVFKCVAADRIPSGRLVLANSNGAIKTVDSSTQQPIGVAMKDYKNGDIIEIQI